MAALTAFGDAIFKLPCPGPIVCAHSRQKRYGATLIELLVVLFIIAVMFGLLFPAIQSARARVRVTACQNNTRQLSIALQNYVNTSKKFPEPNQWTIDILKWTEEWPLAEQLAGGIDEKNKNSPRPPLYRCPAQPDILSAVPDVGTSHYVMTVLRPPRGSGRKVGNGWEIHDRELLSDEATYKPWYVGPELTPTEQQLLFSQKEGPHQGGLFYSANRAYPQ